MPRFRITITDTDGVCEGLERHSGRTAARLSALRSAVSIMLERKVGACEYSCSCEVRDEHSGTGERFEIALQLHRLTRI